MSPLTGESGRRRPSSLHASEENFRLFVEGVRDYAIVMLDPEGRVATWNAGAELVMRYQSEQIIERHFSVFYPAVDVAAGKPDRALEIARAEGRLEDEGWRIRRDGTRFWANVVITAVRDSDGTLRGFGKITRDLTERRRGEEAMRASEERFRQAFHDAPVGLAITAATPDALGRCVDVNNALCALMGYDRERMLGMHLGSLAQPQDVDRDDETLRGLLSGEIGHFQGERRYIHAAGHVIDVSVGVSLVRDAHGRPLHFITQVADISARKRYERELRHMASHDPLTGLLNRMRLEEALDAHIARVRRFQAGGALLIIDLDHFKKVNDSLGHTAGDQVLASVSRILQTRVRDTDILARMGGDEFVVLMTDGGVEQAQTLATDLSDLIRQRSALVHGGLPDGVTASIGIAVFDDSEPQASDGVLLEADTALYLAKQGGRNRIVAYVTDEGGRHRVAARSTLHQQIDAALEEDRFELYLQPVLDLRTGQIGKHEALLRMVGEDGSVIPPAAFLYVAERFDQIRRIDRHVISQAIALLSRLPRAQAIEVNLSGRSLGDPQLVVHITDSIAANDADPERLIFEITETAAVENIQRAREFVDEITDLGCHFALDDFGAGFGSFYYLKHLPFDFLKIDGEFVQNSTDNRADRLIIESCVQLARGLGKQTIAEYVEDGETLRLLRTLGVDHAQGYGIGRPLPVEEALAQLN